MPAAKDLVEKRFGRLVVIKQVESDRSKAGKVHRRYLCRCDCGNLITARARSLVAGNTMSCKCLRAENLLNRNLKHGHRKRPHDSPTYESWAGMIARCTNSNHVRYHRYGGRGIRVCRRWLIFKNFLEDMGERPAGMTLERGDNDGHYEPTNCHWAGRVEQCNNQISNTILTYRGRSFTMAEFSRKFKIPYRKVQRLYKRHNLTPGQILEQARGDRGGD